MLNDSDFRQFQHLIKANLGITIKDDKKTRFSYKLDKLMTAYDIKNYQQLEKALQGPRRQSLWFTLSDVVTTNKTDFFRENKHFDFIKQNISFIVKINPRIRSRKEIRAWSAGCASGEEPYTLAMVLSEELPNGYNIKILGTDISHEVLLKAQKAVYKNPHADTPSYYLSKYFQKRANGVFQVVPTIKQKVTIRAFNLMHKFPFKRDFDMIFCRNVMIYFDRETQERLINKFYQVLAPGGLLFIGHSESLSSLRHHFKYLQPTIYQR